MPECNHDEVSNKKSTLKWVTSWNESTAELTCTVCGEVLAVCDKTIKSAGW